MILSLLLSLTPTVDLAAVGDVMLGRYVGRRIAREGAASIFSGCAPELRAADFAVGNLECVLSKRAPTANKQIRLVADPALAPSIALCGFGAMSVANNHALDCGREGLADTTKALSKAGIRSLSSRIQLVTVNGLRIALLGYSSLDNPVALKSGGSTDPIIDLEPREMVTAIQSARKQADVVVVFWHWGTELSPKVDARQRRLAVMAALAGADVVLGAHPHVLQPIEWLPGANGRRCLAAYSLGNFIFDSRPGAERRTGILHVNLDKSGAKGFRLSGYHIERGAPKPD